MKKEENEIEERRRGKRGKKRDEKEEKKGDYNSHWPYNLAALDHLLDLLKAV